MTEFVPHGYISVHEAVNRLGRELFPEAWTGEEYEARSGLISEEEWLKITDLAPARGGGAPGSAPLRTPIAASAATAPHRTGDPSSSSYQVNSRANIDWRSRRRGCAVNTRSNPEALRVGVKKFPVRSQPAGPLPTSRIGEVIDALQGEL